MNTLFERNFQLTTDTDRPQIIDWVKRAENPIPGYDEIVYDIKTSTGEYNAVWVRVFPYSDMGYKILLMVNSADGFGHLHTVYDSMEDERIVWDTPVRTESKRGDIDDILDNGMVWNDELNIPSDMLEDMRKELYEYFEEQYDII